MTAAPFIQANTNGRLHGAHEPSIPPLDRAFLYGDAIYEVWRTYHGVLFAWEEHWHRLGRSASAMHLELPWTAGQILGEIRRTVAAYRGAGGGGADLYVRLQVSRGAGPIGLDTGLADSPLFVILVQPCPVLPAATLARGLRLSVAGGLRRNPPEALNPAWKTGNYLNNVLALREARSRGADEVVILNLRGEIAEAAVSNIGFAKGGVLITPPLDAGILAGITRGFVIGGVAASAGLEVREAAVRPGDLPGMDECFLMSTTRDIVPVGSVDGVTFAVTESGATHRLKTAFAAFALNHARSHTGHRVEA